MNDRRHDLNMMAESDRGKTVDEVVKKGTGRRGACVEDNAKKRVEVFFVGGKKKQGHLGVEFLHDALSPPLGEETSSIEGPTGGPTQKGRGRIGV